MIWNWWPKYGNTFLKLSSHINHIKYITHTKFSYFLTDFNMFMLGPLVIHTDWHVITTPIHTYICNSWSRLRRGKGSMIHSDVRTTGIKQGCPGHTGLYRHPTQMLPFKSKSEFVSAKRWTRTKESCLQVLPYRGHACFRNNFIFSSLSI